MAANERQKDPNIEDNFEKNNPSLFFLLIQVMRILLAKPANHVTPVPEEVQDAANEELEEPWEEHLKYFVQTLIPTSKPEEASTAAEVRAKFAEAAAGSVEQRDVRLKLARKGFHESTQAIKTKVCRSTKRVYEYNFKEGNSYVQLGAGKAQTV